MRTRARLPAHMRLLLTALADPGSCTALNNAELDVLVRTARSARLLGVLGVRLERAGCLEGLPLRAAGHLHAAIGEAEHRCQLVRRQLAAVEETLAALPGPLVALKGAAYILHDRAVAQGRLPADVDILVERGILDEAERRLIGVGWTFTKTDPRDQRYYRAWSHELPPLRAPAMPFELDVHHHILPPLGRIRPDIDRLLAGALPVAGSRWRTLGPADQVLHAAAHLIQDSDCVGRLRDLVDIDGLLRESLNADPAFPQALAARATNLGLERPLWYALDISGDWLGTPSPMRSGRLDGFAPPWPASACVAALARRCLCVIDPDGEPAAADRLARAAMGFRAQWLRMPPWLLAFHATSKLLRRNSRPAEDAAA